MRWLRLQMTLVLLSAGASTVWSVPVQMASPGLDRPDGNGSSYRPSISADGRFVAFESYASNLVPDDTNGAPDVFVYDRITGAVVRASVDSLGRQAERGGQRPAISADGKWVAFDSSSADLAPDDGNVHLDVFAHNLDTGETILISHTKDGKSGNNASLQPSISSDGGRIVFESVATDLVDGDTNHAGDIFMYNRMTKQTSLISKPAADGANGASQEGIISANGRYIAFTSWASNLVASDTNGVTDVFIKDMQGGQLSRASVVGASGELNGSSEQPAISSDGRFVVFQTLATNASEWDRNTVRDVFLRDRASIATVPVSVGMGGTMAGGAEGAVSPCGAYVVFSSGSPNIVTGDTNGYTDVFLCKVITRDVVRVPVTRTNAQATLGSSDPVVSEDGNYVAFVSRAANIIPGESGGQQVYVTSYAGDPDLPAFIRAWRQYEGGAPPAGIDQNADNILNHLDADRILGKFLQYIAGL